MVQAIFCFLCSIIVSLGGSVTADNVGQDFATIYSNQDPSVQAKMDEYFLGNPGTQLMQDISFQSIKLSTEMLYNIQDGKVTNDVIKESVGIDAWNDFVKDHQNNIAVNGENSSISWSTDNGYTVGYVYAYYEVPGYAPGTYYYCAGELWVFDSDGNKLAMLANIGKSGSITEADILGAKSVRFSNLTVDSTTGKWICDCDFLNYNIDIENPSRVHYDLSGTCPYFVDTNLEESIDSVIGTITDAAIAGTEIGTVPIAADGSITLPDGTRVFPNADGSFTIGDTTYYPSYNLPAYNDAALKDLLNLILQRLDDLENDLQFEQEGDTTISETLEEAQDAAIEDVQSSDVALSQYTYASPKWTSIFPFCIPWDFVRGVRLLSATPTAPRFSIPFEIPSFGQFPGYRTDITLDLGEYEKYFQPVRWFTTIFFLIGLGFVTFKIVKGAA